MHTQAHDPHRPHQSHQRFYSVQKTVVQFVLAVVMEAQLWEQFVNQSFVHC